MRFLFCTCILAGCLMAQDATTTATTTTNTKTTRQHAVSKPVKKTNAVTTITTIPKDAVETTPGFYRWTDKDGKAWTYRRTPFGVSRWPEASVNNARDTVDKEAASGGRTTAVDAGDSIRFEEATPFGKRTWLRKKTELNDNERKIWDLRQKNSTSNHTAEKE